MSRFRQELKVIPGTARFIAALTYIAGVALVIVAMCSSNSNVKTNSMAFNILFPVIVSIFPAIYVLLIGYVHADAKRRGMRYLMWTLLAIFIPNAIGIILYFILRDPLMKSCPGCSQVLKSGYTFCPHCGTSLLPTCPNCGRGVELGWANCPQCGTKLPSPTPRAA